MKTLHLTVTNLCDRACPHCCNKQYDIPNLQYVSDEDFRECDLLCLTGGEPFVYANPCNLARYYKNKYPHLRAVIVYTNAYELQQYILGGGIIHDIDGVSVSIKDSRDEAAFEFLRKYPFVAKLPMNRVYSFLHTPIDDKNYEYIDRVRQENFVPAENCLFRRGN